MPVRTVGTVARAVRRVEPVWFAMVMATGIVSAALRQDGLPGPAAALLIIAAVCFVLVAAATCWRAALFPGDLCATLSRPDQAFTLFAFVAASGVLGNGLAGDGYPAGAAVLAGAALAAWLALTCLIPARLAAWSRARPLLTWVNGTWYLWAVGTQSVAIATAFVQADGLLPARLAAAVAVTLWSAGVVLYLAIMILVLARLLLAGLGPTATAPYWVAMGAASISVFAAARTLSIPAVAAMPGARRVITVVAACLWVVATGLIPALIALSTVRRQRPARPHFSPLAWVVVFPLGMYAMAGLQLGADAGLSLIRHVGAAAVWPAAAAWTLTFAAMAVSPLRANRC